MNVCFGDLDIEGGKELETELTGTKFVRCDTTSWEDQVHLFDAAKAFSPTKEIHHVVANAGISTKDEVFRLDENRPQKPGLKTIDVNLNVGGQRYVKTKILSEEAFEHVKSKGVDFATVEDAGQCLLRILSDREVNVHSFFLSPRKWASRGYVDFELEDYEDELLKEGQKAQLKGAPPEDGLFM
ncbi:hypothetical protein KCU67_g12555, partial [Aureobasidium melanogenum]